MEIKLQKVFSISLPFVVEPHLEGCPVKVVQFCKLHNQESSVFVTRALHLDIINRNFRYKENASNTDKRITNEKNGTRKQEVSFVCSIITSLHLSPGAKMAHRASTCAFHRFLSCAAVRASLQDCHPASDLSFSTVGRQSLFLAGLAV